MGFSRKKLHPVRDSISMAINLKPYTILFDPDRIFKRGATFTKADFEISLEAGVWSWGMIIETEGVVYKIIGTKLLPLKGYDDTHNVREYSHTR